MTIEQAKQISLEDYLQCLGHFPVRRRDFKVWYYSPLRNERTPSFKVNTDRNLWYDYGIGKGGGIIELVMEMHHTGDISHVLKLISQHSNVPLSWTSPTFQHVQSEPTFKDVEVLPLTNHILLEYLSGRGLNIIICQQFCREVHYLINNKSYYAIGFPNRSGGYELRNPFFKGCISPKDISIIQSKGIQKDCCIFEGFVDFLSYLTLQKQEISPFTNCHQQDYVVLNSVSNLRKAMPELSSYDAILSFLDNDRTGQDTHCRIAEQYGDKVQDMSTLYSEFKDVNDFLCRLGLNP